MIPFIPRQEPFTCDHCGAGVAPIKNGSYRNHCPHCLFSKHVDLEGHGDRKSPCGGLMMPVQLNQSGKKGWVITHECTQCGKKINNKAAEDDNLLVLSI